MTRTMRTKRAKEEDEEVELVDEEDDDDFVVDDDDSEEEKPKKKSKAAPKAGAKGGAKGKAAAKPKSPAKKPAAKRTKKKEEEEDEGEEAEEKPKPKKPKTEKLTERTDLGDGWIFNPPSLLAKDYGAPHSTKIAAFDFDGTLVVNKSGAQFPVDANDWKLYNPSVPDKLQQYHKDGYKIAVFTNQGGIKTAITGAASEKFRARFTNFQKRVGVPLVVMVATQKDEHRKPGTGMWEFMCSEFMQGEKPDISQSFFVGDSIDGGDEGFAEALGLTYRSEKQEFGAPQAGADASSAVNAELVDIFNKLAAAHEGDAFKSRAYKAVASVLSDFPDKITNDKAVLKKVNALKGVGKGSMQVIQEFLTTGSVARLSDMPAEKVAGGAGMAAKDRDDALQFM